MDYSHLASFYGGKNVKIVDCTHTISPETFTFIGCLPGGDKMTFHNDEKCMKCGEETDPSFASTKFSQQTIIDTRKPEGGPAFRKC